MGRQRKDAPREPSKQDAVWDAVSSDKRLNPGLGLLLMRAAKFKASWWEAHETIAKVCGMSGSHVTRSLAKLESWRYLRAVGRRPSLGGGWTTEYVLNVLFLLCAEDTMTDDPLCHSRPPIVSSEAVHYVDRTHNLIKELVKTTEHSTPLSVAVRAPVHSETLAADNVFPDPSPQVITTPPPPPSPRPTREAEEEVVEVVVSVSESSERTQTTERANGARRLREPEPEPWTEPDSLRIIETLAARLVGSGMERLEAQRKASKTYAEDPAAVVVDGKGQEPDEDALTVSTDAPRQDSSAAERARVVREREERRDTARRENRSR